MFGCWCLSCQASLTSLLLQEKSATDKRFTEEKEEKGTSQDKDDREVKDPPKKQSNSKP